MATKTKAVKVLAPPLEYSTPASLIMAAVAGKANLEQVEKLMILQERFEKRQAEKAYNKAMSEFKANPPQIIKDCQVSFKSEKTGHTTSYKYAELVNIVEKIDPELSKYGLSSTWCPKQENGKIGVTCRISHVLGHREEGTLWADADTSGSKNAIQAMGSTITYLQRYTVLPLLGLACSRDDDGNKASGKEFINEKQLSSLLDCLAAKELSEKKLLEYLKIEKLEDLPADQYMKAVGAINAAVKVAK